MPADPLDKRLRELLGEPAATALAEFALISGAEFRFTEVLVSGRSSALVLAVIWRRQGKARKLILKHLNIPPEELADSEYPRHTSAYEGGREFAEAHLTQPFDGVPPIRVPDGSWILLQTVAGGGLNQFALLTALLAGVPGAAVSRVTVTPVACDRDSFARACAGIVTTVLREWVTAPDTAPEPVSVTGFLDKHLRERIKQGSRLHSLATQWPGDRVQLPEEAQDLPNPLAIAMGTSPLSGLEVTCLVGHGHGDLHTDNTLVARPPWTGMPAFYLIDLPRYDPHAPTTYDPAYLVLSIVNRTLAELAPTARSALISVLLDPRDDARSLLPAWLSTLVEEVARAGESWAGERGFVDEWQINHRLSLLACALIFFGRPSTEESDRPWFLRLAARAAHAYATGRTTTAQPAREDHEPTRTPTADAVARLCLDLPDLRKAAATKGCTPALERLLAVARHGGDVANAYSDLNKALERDEPRHSLSALRGGSALVGDVFICPLEYQCDRRERGTATSGQPRCNVSAGGMIPVEG